MGNNTEESNPKKQIMRTFAKEGVEASGPREKDPRKKPPPTE